jgi:glycosyltransferase involved in cell wall biosynthesis
VITVIIPYKEGEPIGKPPVGDEVLWIDSGLGIGEARIKGALEAKYDWLVMADADGYYPDDYIQQVKQVILSGKYPNGFYTNRRGGFGNCHESGLIVKKDFFLERVKGFVPDHRKDVYDLFRDLPLEPSILYWHPLTETEKGGVLTAGKVLLLALLCS